MNCSICGKSVTVISETTGDGNPIVVCEECTLASSNNNEDSPTSEERNFCLNHPTVEANFKCDKCGHFICKTCAFPQPDGKSLCPECIQKSARKEKTPPMALFPEGTMCNIHPNVPAVQICQICKLPVCKTCNFDFPNNVHVCPNCINKPTTPTPQQKKHLIYSYVLAGVGTFGFIFSVFFQRLFETRLPAQIIGLMFIALSLAPAIAGLSLSISARTRNRKKPLSVWMAIIWNSFLLGLFFILMIIGNFMS